MTIAVRPTPAPGAGAEADARFDGIADPVEQALAVLRWAGDTFGAEFAITSSMADGLLAHLASRVDPRRERRLPRHRLPLRRDDRHPRLDHLGPADHAGQRHSRRRPSAEQDLAYGPKLHDRDPDLCCSLRKVKPLAETLAGYVAWGSGIRRDESPTRAGTQLVDWDAKRGMVKVNPMAAWTQDVVDAYIAEHQVPVNPLFELGYGSIGCAPCTRPVAPARTPRAGRWAGKNKIECGIHT